MYTRYGVYFTPEAAFAVRGAAWLGWDIAAGKAVAQTQIAGLDLHAATDRPRKYGFHATIKPPFALQSGHTERELHGAFEALCATIKPISLGGLSVTTMGRFLALTPAGDQSDLRALAAVVVRQLDPFRAPVSEAEIARRQRANLSPAQQENLALWGYPYVMDQFRFHMTLTGPLKDLDAAQAAAQAHFAPIVPDSMRLDALALVGERPDGMFCEIDRIALTG